MSLSNEAKQVIRNSQAAVERIKASSGYKFEPVFSDTRRQFFAQFNEWFPESKYRERDEVKPQRLRHAIVMALIGSPFKSMNDLSERIWRHLIDVTRSNSRYLDSRVASEILHEFQRLPFSPAWNVLDWDKESPPVSDMREPDSDSFLF